MSCPLCSASVKAVERMERKVEGLRAELHNQAEAHRLTAGVAAALNVDVDRLRAALADCMQYVDCENLTQQTKHRNWQAVLDGKPWNPANVEVRR